MAEDYSLVLLDLGLPKKSARKKIFEKTRELDINKVALGHHKDDAIQTVLLNMIFHGSISSLPQVLSMFDGRILLVRPLLQIPEEELTYYASLREFKKQEKSCPFEGTTKRGEIEGLVRQLNIDRTHLHFN